ncbi:MAG: hypothetical protein KDD53_05905 [Bdellovibrionales bacterium]|nr:hypothetical protein [Bdellovibrionales bacterium]
MENTEQSFWKKCSICKKEIAYGANFYLCSVSTCRHPRTGYRFCSVQCWDGHLGYVRHRESWAEDAVAPLKPSSTESTSVPVRKVAGDTSVRRIIADEKASDAVPNRKIKTDVLVVVSKVKKLIAEQAEMNTSQCCIDALTDKVVDECLKAIVRARESGRKTVMGRDVK